MEEYLGKSVKVVMDRPLGSRHPEYDFIYPVNYGYIPNTKAGDGEEIDAYILGEFEPVEEYEGRVIAVIKRHDDNEDKLVVSKDGCSYNKEQIRALTEFQERYFDGEIITYTEKESKKTIRFTARGLVKRNDEILVIEAINTKTKKVFYYLPGGGVEFGEESDRALYREFREELNIDILDVEYMTMEEQVFEFEGERKHDVSIVYEVKMPNDFYEKDDIELTEGDTVEKVLWIDKREFISGDKILYPEKLKDYL
ncbi:NUDIX domain-containing protein [Wukongibacter baidiensis]|uniref:NUDIX domain-containing protein n=1 Tax=Wukongibacter baidiensis TaxID=1723361 RepID=UPI003D7F976C